MEFAASMSATEDGNMFTWPSMIIRASLFPGRSERTGNFGGGFPGSGAGLLCALGHHGAAHIHRQWTMLSIARLSRNMSTTPDQALTHAALHAAHQRQSRAFYPNPLPEWAYGCAYNTSEERTAHLPRWLHDYNWHRSHANLSGAPPISRSGPRLKHVLIHDT